MRKFLTVIFTTFAITAFAQTQKPTCEQLSFEEIMKTKQVSVKMEELLSDDPVAVEQIGEIVAEAKILAELVCGK